MIILKTIERIINKLNEGTLKGSPGLTPLDIGPKGGTNLGKENQSILLFNSRFESGNLEQVYKISNIDYSLYLNGDSHNSNLTTQWFYFSVG
jgi:hypothetical protein